MAAMYIPVVSVVVAPANHYQYFFFFAAWVGEGDEDSHSDTELKCSNYFPSDLHLD